jgi:hypothetical protein
VRNAKTKDDELNVRKDVWRPMDGRQPRRLPTLDGRIRDAGTPGIAGSVLRASFTEPSLGGRYLTQDLWQLRCEDYERGRGTDWVEPALLVLLLARAPVVAPAS